MISIFLEGRYASGLKAFLLMFCCFVCWGCRPVERADISLDTEDVIIDMPSAESDSICQITLLMHKIDAAVKNEDWLRALQMLRQLEVQYGSPEFVARLGGKMVFWQTAINKGMSHAVEEVMYKTENVLRLTRSRIEQGDYFFSYMLTKRLAESLEGAEGKDDQIQQVHEQLSFLAERVDHDKISYFPDYVLYRHSGAELQWLRAMLSTERITATRSRPGATTKVVGIRIFPEGDTGEETFVLRTLFWSIYGENRDSSTRTIKSGEIVWLFQQSETSSSRTGYFEIVSPQHGTVRIPLSPVEGCTPIVFGEVFLPRLSSRQMGQAEVRIVAEEGLDANACIVELRHPSQREVTYTCRNEGQGRYISEYLPPEDYFIDVSYEKPTPTATRSSRIRINRSQINTARIHLYKRRTIEMEFWYRIVPFEEAWTKQTLSLTTDANRFFEFRRRPPRGTAGVPLVTINLNGYLEAELSILSTNMPVLSIQKLDVESLSDEIIFPQDLRNTTAPARDFLVREGVYAIWSHWHIHPHALGTFQFDSGDTPYIEVLIHVNSITTDN